MGTENKKTIVTKYDAARKIFPKKMNIQYLVPAVAFTPHEHIQIFIVLDSNLK